MVVLVRHTGPQHAFSFDNEPYQTAAILWYSKFNKLPAVVLMFA